MAARRKKLDIILENYIVVFVFIFAEEQINYLEELMQEEMKESMQEQVSEEIPSSEEGTPAVLEGKRKKKSALIPVLIVLFIILVVIAVYYFATSSPQIRHISKNALVVSKVNLPQLLKESGTMKKGEIDEDLISALEEYNLEALVKDPRSTGLITTKPSYLFGEYDPKKNLPYIFMVMPIANAEKVYNFTKNIALPGGNDLSVSKKSNIYEIDLQGLSCMWTGKSMLIGMTDPNNDNDLSKKVKTYLTQDKSDCILANKKFSRSKLRGHDITLWANLDGMARIAQKGLKDAQGNVERLISQRKQRKMYSDYYFNTNLPYSYSYWEIMDQFQVDDPKNVFESVLLGIAYESKIPMKTVIDLPTELYNTYLSFSADFDKGKMVSSVKFETTPERQKKLESIIADAVNVKDLYPYVPTEGLIMLSSVKTNYPKLYTLTEKRIDKLTKSVDNPEISKLMKHLNKLADGSGIIAVNILDEKEAPFVTLIASVKDNKGIQELLKDMAREGHLRKDGKYYYLDELVIFFEDNVMICTTNHNNYKKSNRNLEGTLARQMNKNPFNMTMDFTALKDLTDDLSDEEEDALDMLNKLNALVKTVGKTSNELKVELTFSDKKHNCLKQIKEYLSDNDDFWKDMTEEIMYTVSYLAKRRDESQSYGRQPMVEEEVAPVDDTTPATADTLLEYNY